MVRGGQLRAEDIWLTTTSDDLQKREPIPPSFYVGNIEEAKSDTAGTADDLDKREPIPPWFYFGNVEEDSPVPAVPAENLEKRE